MNLQERQAAMRAVLQKSEQSRRPRRRNREYVHPSVSPEIEQYARYIEQLLYTEALWKLVSIPIKFPSPARRRREDREIPKAA